MHELRLFEVRVSFARRLRGVRLKRLSGDTFLFALIY